MAENLSKEKRKSDVFEVAGKRLRLKLRQLIHDKMGEDDEDVVEEDNDETVLAHEGEKKVMKLEKVSCWRRRLRRRTRLLGRRTRIRMRGIRRGMKITRTRCWRRRMKKKKDMKK